MNNAAREHAVRVARTEDVSPVVAQVTVSLHANGALSIQGPQDHVWTLAALENAVDAVRSKLRREDTVALAVPSRDVDVPSSPLIITG